MPSQGKCLLLFQLAVYFLHKCNGTNASILPEIPTLHSSLMNASIHISVTLLAALTLNAGTIDVSASQTVLVSGGDTLSFELFTGSYRSTARLVGLSQEPEALRFALVTSPSGSGHQFSAALRSADSSIVIGLDEALDFTPGYYAGSRFQGAVSTLQGQFLLASAEAQELLKSGSLWIDFKNLGGNLTLGLEPLTLNHDLYASLSAGPLSVGITNGEVLLQHPVRLLSARILVAGFQPNGFTATPEPGSAWVIACGSGLLLGLSVMRRFSGTRKSPPTA